MKNKNNQIINQVKKHIKSSNLKIKPVQDIEDKDVVETLISKKKQSLDSMIEKEIKKWINLNAEKISREIINETIKKLFK